MAPAAAEAAELGIGTRSADDGDKAFLAALYASTRRDEPGLRLWPAEMRDQFLAQQFDAQHRHYVRFYPDGEWLILEREGTRIGRLYVEESASQLRLIDISLIPERRDAGLGGALLRDLQRRAAAAGKPLVLHVQKDNRARSLYARLGFATVQQEDAYDRMEWPAPGESEK